VIDPVWHVASFDHLKLMLQYCDAAIQQEVGRNIVPSFSQQLELTLPWGMDDGNAVVRLTITRAPYVDPGPRGVLAVIVFAEAVRFGEDLDPPHYPGHDKPAPRKRAVPRLATSVAEYLREQTDGGPLEAVGDGSLRFVLYRIPQ
jgi:hypothetical protein